MPDFKDIVGQEQLVAHMKHALETGEVSHAYILNGEQYSGKEFLAKIFAQAIQCENSKVEPCQICHSCKQALTNNHPDIIYVTHEKPNSIGIEEVREQIVNTAEIAPYESEKKIYIVRESEKMTIQAQNALLKTLEEPPEYVVILLLTSNVNALLPTIQSRCVELSMKPAKDMQVKAFLQKAVELPDYRVDVCVAFARGNVGKAKLLATSEEFDTLLSNALHIVKNVHQMEIRELANQVKQISEYKLSIEDYLDIMTVWYRDVLLYKATKDVNQLVFREEIGGIRKMADHCGYEGIEDIIAAIDAAKKRIKANVSFELTMELLFMTIKENT